MTLAINSSIYAALFTTLSVTLSTSSTNCTILVFMNGNAANTVASVTDTAGLSFAPLIQGTWGFGWPQEVWYATSAAMLTGDVITVNMTSAKSGSFSVSAVAISGSLIATPLDTNPSFPNQNHQNSPPITSMAPSAPLSTNNPNTMILGQFTSTANAPGAITRPSGYSQAVSGGTGSAMDIGYQINSSRQSGLTPTYNWANSVQGQGVVWVAIQSNQLYSGIATTPSRGNGIIQANVGNPGGGTAPYTYQWYRSTTSGFTPGAGNIVSGATSQTLNDTGLTNGTIYYYVCIVTDNVSATANSNQTAGIPGVSNSYAGGFIGM